MYPGEDKKTNLITHYQANFVAMDDVGMEPECFIGDHQHMVHLLPAT